MGHLHNSVLHLRVPRVRDHHRLPVRGHLLQAQEVLFHIARADTQDRMFFYRHHFIHSNCR